MASDFQRLVSEYNLAGFTVGYPLNRQQIAPDDKHVKVFIDDLCNTGKLEGLAYTYWDECFITRNVEFLLKPLNIHQSKIVFDKFAAVGILQMKYVKPLQLFKDVLKRKASGRPRLLGLDVGDKYIGLAVSDPNNKIASPVSFLHRKRANIDLMASNFQRLVSEYNLAGVIVGYPLNRQQIARDAVQVKVFVDELCNTGRLEGLAYTYWDECFTTRNVEFLLKPLNLHQLKIMLDKFAAVGILQAYLDSVNKLVKLEAEEQTNVGSFNEVVSQFNCITEPFEAEGKRKL